MSRSLELPHRRVVAATAPRRAVRYTWESAVAFGVLQSLRPRLTSPGITSTLLFEHTCRAIAWSTCLFPFQPQPDCLLMV